MFCISLTGSKKPNLTTLAATLGLCVLAGFGLADTWHYLSGGKLSGVTSVGNLVWVVGQDGLMFHSNDNGEHWRRVPRFTSRNLVDVDFWDGALGLITSGGDVIFRTTNCGATWDSTYFEYAEGRMRFLEDNAVMIDGRDRLLWSTDNGATWMVRSELWGPIWFVDTVYGWGGPRRGRSVARSTDGGWSWVTAGEIPDAEFEWFWSFGFRDRMNGVCNYYGDVAHPRIPSYSRWARTSDGGVTWHLSSYGWSEMCDVSPQGLILGLEESGCRVFSADTGWFAPLHPPVRASDVAAAHGQRAWICGEGGTVWSSVDQGSSWVYMRPGTGAELQGVVFSDSLHGWAVCEHAVLRSGNAGRTWFLDSILRERTAPSRGFFGLSVVDDSTVYVAEDDVVRDGELMPYWSGTMVIHRTTNSGTTWDTIYARFHLVAGPWGSGCLFFLDAEHGWHVGNLSGINSVRTTDRGATWVPVGALPYPIGGRHFVDAVTGWATCSAGRIHYTTDSGNSWSVQLACSTARAVHMVSAGEGWVAADDGLYHTTDGGQNWELVPVASGLKAVHFSDDRHGVAVGDCAAIVRTTDGGEMWMADSSEFSSDLHAVFVLDSTHAWAVGEHGLVLGFGDWAVGTEEPGFGGSNYWQTASPVLWPNPCRNQVRLQTGTRHKGRSLLRIYDASGRMMWSLEFGEGVTSLPLDLRGLPAGVYFVSVRDGRRTHTARLVKLE